MTAADYPPETMVSPPGLRERKKERTRRAIADAALDLFERHGYAATTVEDIAAAAEVSPRTFFRYFATKDEAVFDQADEVLAAFGPMLAERPAGEPLLPSLRAVGSALLSPGVLDEGRFRRVLALAAEEPAVRTRYHALLGSIEREIVRWAAERLGLPTSALRPRLVAAVAMTALRVATDTWLDAPGTELGDHVTAAIDMLAEGLAGDGDGTPGAAPG